MKRIMKMDAALVVLLCAAPALTRAAAPPGRYTASAGTVTDTKTKLVWQEPFAPSTMTWAAAKSYCAGLGATLGGSGWRLPTIKELQTLVDVSVSAGPAIDPKYFPNTGRSAFWSSTPSTADTSVAWMLAFSEEGELQAGMQTAIQVRCVR